MQVPSESRGLNTPRSGQIRVRRQMRERQQLGLPLRGWGDGLDGEDFCLKMSLRAPGVLGMGRMAQLEESVSVITARGQG